MNSHKPPENSSRVNTIATVECEVLDMVETIDTKKIIEELAKLPPIEYSKIRKDEARKLGLSLSILDNLIKDARKNNSCGGDSLFIEIEPWHESINPEELLSDITKTIQRFIVCEPETALAATLWATMTWFIDVVQVAPLAIITAPEKRCGKTQMLSILGKISYRPLLASNVSPAALFRSIDKWQPTLLIDETDTFVKNCEEFRGLLDAGHTRDSAFTLRCIGENHELKKFNLWGAKALSGIGNLPDTLMDRAIILRLRRKLPYEHIERLRYAPEGLFETLQQKLARFAKDYNKVIKDARPALPEVLNDRAQDNWESLLKIADTAGHDYGCLVRNAAIKLSCNNEDTQSLGIQLLSDIYEVFEAQKVSKISSEALINALCEDNEKLWVTYNFRSASPRITPKQLGKLLSDYGIKSSNMREGTSGKIDAVKKGYYRSQFEDVFKRYLPSVTSSEISATPATMP